MEEWRREQLGNLVISVFLKEKELGRCPLREELSTLDPFAKVYLSYWDALLLKEVLYKKWESPNFRSEVLQVNVPWKQIKRVLEAHDSSSSGHFGVNKTLDKIRKRFYWAICKDVEN